MKKPAAVVATAVTAVLLSAAAASAAASPNAGCMGIGSAGNAGYPGDRAAISHEIKAFATYAGVPPGGIISSLAQTHAGSTDACFG